MRFTSDNAHGAAAPVLEALGAADPARLAGYGEDAITARVEERLREAFETDLRAFPVATGTAANALALATLCPPWGAVLCHRLSHVQEDECGAPEFFGGGLKLVLLDGDHGRVAPGSLAGALARTGPRGVHQVQPAALSLTNVTEMGTIYSPDAIAALSETARARGCAVHLDGARFANAVAASGAAPADLTWRAGVDALSLGATKNGCLAAEAVVFFDPDRQRDRIRDFAFRRKRGGHLLSKGWALSAQLDAWLTDGLWLRLAEQANAAARRLAEGLAASPGVAIAHPVEANMIFARIPLAAHRALRAAGARYYLDPPHQTEEGDGETVGVRLVCGFATTRVEIDRFLEAAAAA